MRGCIRGYSLYHFTSNCQVKGTTISGKLSNSRARNPKGWNCQRTFLNKSRHVVLLSFLLPLRILYPSGCLTDWLTVAGREGTPSAPPPETNEMVSVPRGRLCYDTDSTYFMGKLPRVHMCLCLSPESDPHPPSFQLIHYLKLEPHRANNRITRRPPKIKAIPCCSTSSEMI